MSTKWAACTQTKRSELPDAGTKAATEARAEAVADAVADADRLLSGNANATCCSYWTKYNENKWKLF